ncbi:MAG: Hsp20/alpha crystallin family protein [Spirochaetota bacterium]|nr:Hsp20/alpha crystallin family protein [Spirochaetota bacterium]
MTTEVTKLKKDEYNCEECVIVPPVDIYETENEYILKAELPGVAKKDIDITLDNKELEIYGKVDDEFAKEDNQKYSEYKLYNYSRKFKVGDGIDNNKLTANLDNGLLTVVLPKSEGIKPKKIEIH